MPPYNSHEAALQPRLVVVAVAGNPVEPSRLRLLRSFRISRELAAVIDELGTNYIQRHAPKADLFHTTQQEAATQ